LAVVGLTRADPDEIGILLGDGDVADRHQPLILEQRREHRAIARRLPHAAVRGADVIDGGIGFVYRHVGDASRHRRRPYRSEVQLLEFFGDGR
jgi:hypothetical protein